jgi:hypothetical protein
MADPITAAVSAIATYVSGAFAATAAGTATLAQTATVVGVNLAASAAVSAAATALLQPDTGFEGSPLEWRADPTAGVPFALGRVAAAGRIVHRDEWGADNRYQSIWTVCSGAGPIQQIEGFYADDVAVSFGANGAASTGPYADKMWLQTKLGASSDTALAQTGLDAATPGYEGWNASKALPYRASCQLTLYQDSKFKSYPSGEPRTRLTLKGIKLYDPRLDSTVPGGSGSHRWGTPSTYAYSDNAALLALNWAMGLYEGSKLVGGIGAGSAGVHLPAFMEWANVCDANGWTASAYPSSLDDRHQVLLGLMQAGGARYARFAGKISCIVSAPKSSVVTLSVEDTAGPFEIATNADRLEKINTLVPTCRMESHNWEDVPQDEISVAEYVTADGGVIDRDLSYPYVALHADGSNADQIAELAAYAILDSREPFSGTVPLKPWAMQIEPGDVFTITEPGFLLDAVELKCLTRSFDPMTNIVRVSFISESAGKHDFALGRTNTAPVPATLTVPDIYDVPPPAIDVWSASAGNGQQPTIVVTGSADQDNAKAIIVEYRTAIDPATDAAWADDDAGWRVFGQYDIATEGVVLTGLEPETAYQVAVKYVSQFGVIGDRRILGTITTGGMTATDALRVGDYTYERLAALADEVIATGKSAAQATIRSLIEEANQRRGVERKAVNLFVQERTERITATEAVQSSLTLQISAVDDALALVEDEVTTLASDLVAETNTRTTQISALNDSIAGVQTSVTTVADDLSAFTESTTTQFSAVGDSLASLTLQFNTLADDQEATSSALTLLEADVNTLDGEVGAIATDLTAVSASVDELLATRLIAVQAGTAFAGVQFSARQSDGNPSSDIRFAAGQIKFGPAFASPRFVIDMDGSEVYSLNAAGTVKTFQLDMDTGRLQLRTDAGVLVFDSAAGGIQVAGLPPSIRTDAIVLTGSTTSLAATYQTLATGTLSGASSEGLIRFAGQFNARPTIVNVEDPLGEITVDWRIVLSASGETDFTLASGTEGPVGIINRVISAPAAMPYGGNVSVVFQARVTGNTESRVVVADVTGDLTRTGSD